MTLSSHSVVGVPSAEDWPQEVALPQSAFTPRPPKPIENLVPDMDEQGRALLMVHLKIQNYKPDLVFLIA